MQEFVVDNNVIFSVHLERFPLGVVRILHAERTNSYKVSMRIAFTIYSLDISRDPYINLIFNEDYSIISIASASLDLLSSESLNMI